MNSDYLTTLESINSLLMVAYHSMSTPDLIGWIGNLFFVYGVWAIGERKVSGFYVNYIGNLAYLIQGAFLTLYSLIVLSSILMLLNVVGIVKWRKDNG